MSSLFGSLDTTKLDKADVVDPSTATEDGKAADAKSTYEELARIFGMASDAKELAESKADQFALEAHVASTNNPHSVTAEQVNAYTKETVDAKLDEKADIVGGKIPASQLPSYVDDVLEYDTMSAFPVTGEGGKIYVAKDTNLTYRWSGTQYVEISPSPLLDDTVTEKSPNGVKSSGIWSWVKSLLPKWLTSDYAEPATVASVKAKADNSALAAHTANTDNPHAVTAKQVGAVPLVEDVYGAKTAVTIGVRKDGECVGEYSFANGGNVTASGYRSHAEGGSTTASADNSHSEGSYTTASNTDSHAEGNSTTASGPGSHAEGISTTASGIGSHAAGIISETREEDKYAFAWNGDDTRISTGIPYPSHGPGTFNINPVGGLNGFWIGQKTFPQAVNAALAPEYSATSAYSVGAIVYHDGSIYQCKTAIADGGEAWNVEHWEMMKLDDFFTESNSLLTDTIDAEIVEKGTAPDAHLEAPTDDRLKLILANNSVAYDSAKALPYKLTSAIGDRVVATMTLTAASTDITLPTISANDTTVKDFILDVTNAYAVEGVATDAGINIPRTDFKLVTRDGESLTAVTTVKAGKSAFICFTQKSPVVVDGTTYPCWCVIQLPFGDPS